MAQIICPLSNDKVNNNVARVVASIVIVFTVVAVALNAWWLLLIQLYDFVVRAAGKKNWSIFRLLGQQIADLMNLQVVAVDAAPKKFAAAVGVAFSAAIIVLLGLNLFVPAVVVAGILLVCAFLEAAFSFCVGCYVYTFLVLPFLSSESKKALQ